MVAFKGRALVKGFAEGKAVVVDEISFYGDVDPETGMLFDGRSLRDRILVSYKPRGSTVGSYIIYALKMNGASPKAIIMSSSEPIIVAGCVLSGIPLVDGISVEDLKTIKDGDLIVVKEGLVLVNE